MSAPRKASKHGAFTLIEMLIVLTLGGILLTSATTLLVNMTLLRTFPDNGLHFQLHSSNLQHFLQSAMDADTLPPTAETQSTGTINNRLNNSDAPQDGDEAEGRPRPAANTPEQPTPDSLDTGVKWAWLPEESQSLPPNLEFSLAGDLPILKDTSEILRSVRAQLRFSKGTGLFLVWYYPSRDLNSTDYEIYQRRLSPLVESLEYGYYDAELESWEIEEEPKRELATNDYPMPDYLLIRLKDPNTGAENQLQILLPATESEVPHP